MKNFILFIGLFSIIGCANPKKLHKMMDKLPEATAKECSDRFPIKETTDTLYTIDSNVLKAYEDEYGRLNTTIDSLLNEGCDTLYITKIKEVIKTLPAKTNTKVIVKTQESTAKLEVLKNDCNKTITSLSEINTQNVTKIQELELSNGKLKTRVAWMWIIIICLTIFSFRRQIFKFIVGFL
jgi:hypothetical protein